MHSPFCNISKEQQQRQMILFPSNAPRRTTCRRKSPPPPAPACSPTARRRRRAVVTHAGLVCGRRRRAGAYRLLVDDGAGAQHARDGLVVVAAAQPLEPLLGVPPLLEEDAAWVHGVPGAPQRRRKHGDQLRRCQQRYAGGAPMLVDVALASCHMLLSPRAHRTGGQNGSLPAGRGRRCVATAVPCSRPVSST